MKDPLAGFGFILDIQGMRSGFSEVSGLGPESVDISSRKLPGKRKYTNIRLKRGYTPDAKEMLAWTRKAADGKTALLSGTLTLLDETGRPAKIWSFRQGWPAKWEGPTFDAKSNDVAIEELELCVEGLDSKECP